MSGLVEPAPRPVAGREQPLSPKSIPELIEIVRSTARLIPVGNQTKPRLSDAEAVKLSTRNLSGITEYDPSEFTFTALAGTPLREILTALAGRGQYLPFDPPLVDAGATLAGTVAAGLSGPGRLRFGGLRDFILGVRFIDGTGKLLRMGGKVVKNAAGFDLPKFFVGTLGRFGMLVELTFKVFPKPPASVTLRVPAKDIDTAAKILIEASNTRWEPFALDLAPGSTEVFIRLEGPAQALEPLADEVLARWTSAKLSHDEANSTWAQLREFTWSHPRGELIKVPLTPKQLPQLAKALTALDAGIRFHASSGANVCFISLPSRELASGLETLVRKLALSGLTLSGSGPLWYGERRQTAIGSAVKTALDPVNRFPSLD